MPERIQLRRTKGWRLSAGAVIVDRRTRWGNPFKVGEPVATPYFCDPGWVDLASPGARVYPNGKQWLIDHPYRSIRCETVEQAVQWYRATLHPDVRRAALRALAGKDLACWCPLDQPCHADVLLEIANTAPEGPPWGQGRGGYLADQLAAKLREETRTVICGSLTCQAAIDTAAAYYRRDGHQVLAPTPDPTRTPAEHDQRWFDAIAQADLVVIVPKPDGTLGEQTTRELAKAGECRVPVQWWTELPVGGAR